MKVIYTLFSMLAPWQRVQVVTVLLEQMEPALAVRVPSRSNGGRP